MRRRHAMLGFLTIGVLFSAHAEALAQFGGFGGFSPVERSMLLGLGARRIGRGDFQRQLFALSVMDRNNFMRQQQFVQQQFAAQRVRAQQAQLRALMSGGRRPASRTAVASTTPETPEQRQEVSDFLLVWEVLGCTFDAEVTDAVKAVDSRFDAGMRVAAIQVGGPADLAGWKAGDILIGLYKFRTRTYDNVAFVAEMPDLVERSPMNAMLIRDGKIIEAPVDFRAPEEASKPQTEEKPESDQSSRALPSASPIATTVEPGGVQPTSADEPTKVVAVEPSPKEKLWQEIGIHCESMEVKALGEKFDRGLKITEVRESSPAQKLGWKAGDVLVGLAGYQTRILSDADYAVAETRAAGSAKYLLLVDNSLSRGTIEYGKPPEATKETEVPSEPPKPSEANESSEPATEPKSP